MKVLYRTHIARSLTAARDRLAAARYFPVAADVADAATENVFSGLPCFVISGSQGAGKDVVAERLAQRYQADGYTVTQERMSNLIRAEADQLLDVIRAANSIADAIDDAAGSLDLAVRHAAYLVGVLAERAEDPDYNAWVRDTPMRKALQYLGFEARSDTHPNYWTEACYSSAASKLAEGTCVYMADGRFEAEITHGTTTGLYVARLYVPEEIRVERIKARDGIVPSLDTLRHFGEIGLDSRPELFDQVIDNSGPASEIDEVVEVNRRAVDEHREQLAARVAA